MNVRILDTIHFDRVILERHGVAIFKQRLQKLVGCRIVIRFDDKLASVRRRTNVTVFDDRTVTGETVDPEQTGRILYIKSSWCGKEWADMAAYKAKNPDFPQQSTGDQFFDEEQFEAYRALGYLIASQLFEDNAEHVRSIADWFQRLEKVATPLDDTGA